MFCNPADWANGYSVWSTNILNTIAFVGIAFGVYQLIAPRQLRGQLPYFLLSLRRNPTTRLLFESLDSIPEYNEFNSEFCRALELFVYRLNGLARRQGLLKNRFGAIATSEQFNMFALSRNVEGYSAIAKIVAPLLKYVSPKQAATIELINTEYRKYFEFGYLTGGFLHTYQLAILVALGYLPSKEELELAYMSLYRLRLKDKTYQGVPLMVYQMYEVGTLLAFLIPNLSKRQDYLTLLDDFEELYRYEEDPPNPSKTYTNYSLENTMNQPTPSSKDRAQNPVTTDTWLAEAKERLAKLSPEERAAKAERVHEKWHEMFGEKIEPVFDDRHNYDVVRPEPWWHRFF